MTADPAQCPTETAWHAIGYNKVPEITEPADGHRCDGGVAGEIEVTQVFGMNLVRMDVLKSTDELAAGIAGE